MKKLSILLFCLTGLGWSFLSIAQTAETSTLLNNAMKSEEVSLLQSEMKTRYKNILKDGLDRGDISITLDGYLIYSPKGKIETEIKKEIDNENNDRKKLYKVLALKQKHPEWEGAIAKTFAQSWLEMARKQNWTITNHNL